MILRYNCAAGHKCSSTHGAGELRMQPERKTTAQYRELVQEFKPDSGQLLACLHKVQHHFG